MNPRVDYSWRHKAALPQLIKDVIATKQKRVRRQAKETVRAKKGRRGQLNLYLNFLFLNLFIYFNWRLITILS